jgi:hypothetical protein
MLENLFSNKKISSGKCPLTESSLSAKQIRLEEISPEVIDRVFFLTVKGPKAPEAPLSGRHNYKEEPEHTTINS